MRYLRAYAQKLRSEGKSNAEIFMKLLLEFTGTPYVWGGATTEGSDCSGTVCTALNALFERERRVTADELYRRFFTHPFLELPHNLAQSYEQRIHALFFLDETGRAVHVAGYIGKGFYMNESSLEPLKCGTRRTYTELRQRYPQLLLVRRHYTEGPWE